MIFYECEDCHTSTRCRDQQACERKGDMIEVSAAALDSLKAMAQRLQDERDELLEMAKKCRAEFAGLPHSLGYEFDYMRDLDSLIAKCTAKPEVLE